MTYDYQTQYNKLLDTLDQDNRPWRPASLLPMDGTKVFLKCGSAPCSTYYKGDILYDVGIFQRPWYCPEGEWCTEFGNMEECNGWKEVV